MGHMHVGKECVAITSQGYQSTQVTSHKPYIVTKIVYGIGEGTIGRSACCVVLSVRVLVKCYGIVQLTLGVELLFYRSYRWTLELALML